MRVTLPSGDVLLARWSNTSEPLAHDGQRLRTAAQVVELRKALKKVRTDPDIGKFLRIKPLKRLSVITTTCTIVSQPLPDVPLSVGMAYYSRAEVNERIPFNRIKAWRMSLGRAMRPWSKADQDVILATFTDFLKRRQIQLDARRAASTPRPQRTHSS